MQQNQSADGDGSRTSGRSGNPMQDLNERLGAAADDVRADAQEKIVDPVKDAVRSTIDERKQAGAKQMQGVAHAIRTAADELTKELPETAGYIRKAADRVDQLSSAVRDRPIEDLFHELDGFAHRQPLTLFGGSLLAGFALSRFLKSSAPTNTRAPSQPASTGGLQS